MHNPRAAEPPPDPVRPPSFVICEIVFQIKGEHLTAYGSEYGIEGLDNALADLREHLPEHLSAAIVGDYMMRSFTAHSITTRVGRG